MLLPRCAHLLAALLCALPKAASADAAFHFAAFGDTPYFAFEEVRLEKLIPQMNREPLAFVLHIGDLKSSEDHCDDVLYRKRKALFDTIEHPFIITPGDNDWTDCHRKGGGRYDPRERLNFFRKLFYSVEPALPIERQSSQPAFADYIENMRWVLHRVAFVTLHVVGSNNNLGRTSEADEEYRARNAADLHWLRESFSRAREQGLFGMVIAMHADAHLELGPMRRARSGFKDLVEALREETIAFGRPVLLIHGDSHTYRFDHPLHEADSGALISNFTRLEVFGAPTAAWVKVTVTPGREPMFAVEPHK